MIDQKSAFWFALAFSALSLGAQEDLSPVDYLKMPPQSRPFAGMGASKGLFQPDRTYIMARDTGLQTSPMVNWQTREVRVQQNYISPRTSNVQPLWSYTYPEIADYAFDLSQFTLRNLWLDGLVGKTSEGYKDAETSTEFKLPGILGDLGGSRPKLDLSGDLTVGFKGSRTIVSNDEYSQRRFLLATPTPTIQSNFKISGKVGKHLTLEMNSTEELGRDDIRLVYKEAEKGEFEDQILQEIEAGRTSLELPGTSLTGFSESHKGLFGIRTKMKFGDVMLTAIASQESGSQESYTLNSQSKETDFTIRDKDFIAYKYYFLSFKDREYYIQQLLDGNKSPVNLHTSKVYVYTVANVGEPYAIDNVTIEYPDNLRAPLNGMRVKLLKEATGNAKDFDYEYKNGIVYLPKGRRDVLYGWSDRSISSGGKITLFKDDKEAVAELNALMLRNRYSVGITEDTKNQFSLRMVDARNQPVVKLSALGIADKSNVPKRQDPTLFQTTKGEMILPCQKLEFLSNRMARTPSGDTVVVPNGIDAQTYQNLVCLEPMRLIDDSTGAVSSIYTANVRDLNNVGTRFSFVGKAKKRSSTLKVSENQSVSSGGCFDISPGTEKLSIGSTQLQKGVDYEVMYEYGQIELLSDRAKDPNNEISVTYECEPMFSIDNKLLLGLRAEYPFWRLGSGSHLGTTMLYKSQSTSESQPRVGHEPFQSLLFGANMKLTDQNRFLTRAINYIPLIETKAPSTWRFEAEVAKSYHNPNTKGSALLDDFESARREIPFLLRRQSWTQASPPGGVESDATWYDPGLDYRHMGKLIWNSNFNRRFAEVFGSSGDERIDVTEVPVLQLDFESNDDSKSGKSWGGLMHSNSDYSRDISQYRYLELVLQGDVGELNFDFGAISEDLSINGDAPNGTLQSEGDPRTGKATNDYGLDGIPTRGGESSVQWTCRSSTDCISQLVNESSLADAGKDDFKLQDRETHPTTAINGTEGNNADRGGGWDSEDLNRNGSLDVQNDFVRYKLDLSKATGFDRLKGGWKRYRISLSDYDTLMSPSRSSLKDILRNNSTTRFWIGNLPEGVNTTQIQIARFTVVGSQWEQGDRSTAYDSAGTIDQQKTETNGIVDLSQSGAKDAHFMQVRVINNRDDIGRYYASPNTLVEREKDSDTPLREQSLVLQYGALHPAQEVTATRTFDSESKDLTQYSDMQLEIHLDGIGTGVRENSRFAVQLGQGDIKGSQNYYEWSFRPRAARCEELKLNLQSTVSDEELRAKLNECHSTDWKANVFRIPLKDLWPLLKYQARAGEQDSLWRLRPENDSGYTLSFGSQSELRAELLRRKASIKILEDELMTASVERRAEILEKLTRLEAIGVVGQPTLSKINWIRFVVRADDDAMAPIDGTLWINDLKLSGVRSGWGTAARSAAQVDLADFITISGDLSYRDGDFATLSSQGSSPMPSLSESKTSIQARSDFKISLDKFLKDDWKTRIPLTISQSTQIERPYLQPGSDLSLTHDKLSDLLPELSDRSTGWHTDSLQESEDRIDQSRLRPLSRGYQSLVENTSIGIGYRRERVETGAWYIAGVRSFLFERPQMNFRFENRQSRSSQSIDTTRNYTTTMQYDMSRKGSPMKLGFRPWPEQFDLTVFDFNYVRNWHKDRALELRADTLSPVRDWQLNLTHKANLQWSLLSFLNLNYTLDLSRLLDDDWEAWGRNGVMGTSSGGFLGRKVFFDWDRSDYEYEIQKRDTAKGISTDRVLTADQSKLGQSYGILYQERKRTQNFRIGFNPKIPYVDFFDQRVNYTADFSQTKSIPEDFNPTAISDVRQNYWTVDRTANFEYRPTFQLQNFVKLFGNDNAVYKGLRKLQWSSISLAWTASVATKGENFTLPFLHDSAGVDPANYYLWAFGFGDGQGLRNGYDIVTGDMRLKSPAHYTRWGQYFSPYAHNLDSLVDQHQYSNSIDRGASADTRLVLPFAWDLSLTGNVAWKMQIQQNRMYPLQIDTTISWPKWSVGSRLPNIVPRFEFLKKYLNSWSFNDRFNFEKQTILHAFQSSEDASNYKWAWEPLIGFQMETKKRITISNDFNVSIERGWKYLNKYSMDTVAGAYELWDIFDDKVTYWTWRDKDFQRSVKFSDKATISYALPTNKGFRIARWFFRLKNPINLSANFNFENKITYLDNYRENKSKLDSTRFVFIRNNPLDVRHPYIVELDTTANPVIEDMNSFGVRTTADYRFTEKITSDASIEYRRDVDGVSGGEKGDIVSHLLSYIFRVKMTF